MSSPHKTKLIISIKMDTFQQIKKSLPGAYSSSDVYAKAHVQDWIGEYVDKMKGLRECSEAKKEKREQAHDDISDLNDGD